MRHLPESARRELLQTKTANPSTGVKKLVAQLQRNFPYVTAKLVREALREEDKARSIRIADQTHVKKGARSLETCFGELQILNHQSRSACVDEGFVETKREVEPLFEIVEVEGKGRGMRATRDIVAGTLVISEAPLVAISAEAEVTEGVEASIERMSAASKSQFFQLHDKDGVDGRKTADGIWKTNVIQLGLSTYGGVFLNVSRVNHSCLPNLQNSWSSATQQIRLIALRDIAAGEELTICYLDILASKEERRAESLERYRFECACAACASTAEEVKISDRRRALVARIQAQLQEGLMLKPLRNLKVIDEALVLLNEEGLPGLLHEFTMPAYRIATLLGLLETAQHWAQRSHSLLKLAYGEDDPRTKLFKRWSAYHAGPRSQVGLTDTLTGHGISTTPSVQVVTC